MNPRARRRRPTSLPALLALGGALLGTVLGGAVVGVPSAGATAHALPADPSRVPAAVGATVDGEEEAAALPVDVRLLSVSPTVLRRGDDLVVTAELRHTGTTPLAEPRVTVSLDRRGFTSRTSLDRARTAAPEDPVGSTVLDLELEAPLAPGDVLRTRLTVPADAVALRSGQASWGPRALAVTVVDLEDPARTRQGIARTFALWYGVEEVPATRVSVLVPLVGPTVDPLGTDWQESLETLTGPGGRLHDVVAATRDVRAVTWAVDPWLAVTTDPERLAAADAAAEPDGRNEGEPGPDDEEPATTEPEPGPSSSGTSAPTTPGDGEVGPEEDAPGPAEPAGVGPLAREWGASLGAASTNREVHLLPYLDADVTALAHADAADLLALARERSVTSVPTTDLPQGATTSLTWPLEDRPDLDTMGVGATTRTPVVLGPAAVPPAYDLWYTTTGRATVETAEGEVEAVVADRRLSEGLRTGRVGVGDPALPAPAEGRDPLQVVTPATATQDLLAELAVLTRERPSDPRHVLLTVDRTWDPADAAIPAAQLAGLADVPWVDLTPLSSLIGTPAPAVTRDPLPRRLVATAEVDAVALETVRAAVEERRGFASMAEEPGALLGDLELERLAPAGAAWRSDPQGRAALVASSLVRTETLRSSVAVRPGSDLTLISTSGGMPVRVSNSLDQPVTVDVALDPDDSRLRSDGPVRVTIAPGGEESVQIPLHAIQSADVDVRILVLTPDGLVVDDDTVVTVQVRADWETIGTAVVGGLLAVGLVLGLVRSIRRGRRRGRRAPPRADAGPDDLSPEDVAAHENVAATQGTTHEGGTDP